VKDGGALGVLWLGLDLGVVVKLFKYDGGLLTNSLWQEG
jgi:hypothetical protein